MQDLLLMLKENILYFFFFGLFSNCKSKFHYVSKKKLRVKDFNLEMSKNSTDDIHNSLSQWLLPH